MRRECGKFSGNSELHNRENALRGSKNELPARSAPMPPLSSRGSAAGSSISARHHGATEGSVCHGAQTPLATNHPARSASMPPLSSRGSAAGWSISARHHGATEGSVCHGAHTPLATDRPARSACMPSPSSRGSAAGLLIPHGTMARPRDLFAPVHRRRPRWTARAKRGPAFAISHLRAARCFFQPPPGFFGGGASLSERRGRSRGLRGDAPYSGRARLYGGIVAGGLCTPGQTDSSVGARSWCSGTDRACASLGMTARAGKRRTADWAGACVP
jgi:hypothetical protein